MLVYHDVRTKCLLNKFFVGPKYLFYPKFVLKNESESQPQIIPTRPRFITDVKGFVNSKKSKCKQYCSVLK